MVTPGGYQTVANQASIWGNITSTGLEAIQLLPLPQGAIAIIANSGVVRYRYLANYS